jgi:Adenosine-deaminase (editase) domain
LLSLQDTAAGGAVADQDSSSLAVIALATGTKCVGPSKVSADGTVVQDSHAEVLVRRCLLRLLSSHLRHAVNQSNCKSSCMRCSSSLLEQSSAGAGRYKLKDSLRLHLYISDPPCGDASIYPCKEACSSEQQLRPHCPATEGVQSCPTSTEASPQHDVKRRRLADERVQAAVCHTAADDADTEHAATAATVAVLKFTGAKALDLAHESVQQLGQLRLKSGRRDLRAEDRTQRYNLTNNNRWLVAVAMCSTQRVLIAVLVINSFHS